MKLLEERIKKDGAAKAGGILKVDSFFNHQMDAALLNELGKELAREFADAHVDKVLTVEASGIAMACFTGLALNVPVLFAKKSKSKNISDDVFCAEVVSFTHGNTNNIIVSKQYLRQGERVLLVDDFLATGAALVGLRELVRQAGGEVVGAGIGIEKVFQGGGNRLREEGMRIVSLAMIESMGEGYITFC